MQVLLKSRNSPCPRICSRVRIVALVSVAEKGVLRVGIDGPLERLPVRRHCRSKSPSCRCGPCVLAAGPTDSGAHREGPARAVLGRRPSGVTVSGWRPRSCPCLPRASADPRQGPHTPTWQSDARCRWCAPSDPGFRDRPAPRGGERPLIRWLSQIGNKGRVLPRILDGSSIDRRIIRRDSDAELVA